MCALLMILLLAEVNPVEKIFHINNPVNTKIGYGIESDGTPNFFPKKKVKSTIINMGCMTAHAKPKKVCLYLTLISRQV